MDKLAKIIGLFTLIITLFIGAWPVTAQDGSNIIGRDNAANLVDLVSIKTENPVTSLAWSPDSHYLVYTSESTVTVWNALLGEDITSLDGGEADFTNVSWSPDGNRVLAYSTDHHLYVWSVEDITAIADPLIIENPASLNAPVPSTVQWSPNGELIVSADSTGLIHIWDAATGTEITTLMANQTPMTALVFSPHGVLLASVGIPNADGIGSIIIWGFELGPNSSEDSATLPIEIGELVANEARFNPNAEEPKALVMMFSLTFTNTSGERLEVRYPRLTLTINGVAWTDLNSTDFQFGRLQPDQSQTIELQSLMLQSRLTEEQLPVWEAILAHEAVDIDVVGTITTLPGGTEQLVDVQISQTDLDLPGEWGQP